MSKVYAVMMDLSRDIGGNVYIRCEDDTSISYRILGIFGDFENAVRFVEELLSAQGVYFDRNLRNDDSISEATYCIYMDEENLENRDWVVTILNDLDANPLEGDTITIGIREFSLR